MGNNINLISMKLKYKKHKYNSHKNINRLNDDIKCKIQFTKLIASYDKKNFASKACT
jgi:hypothetical protein